MDEIKRLVRELLEAWDGWVDSDEWSGSEYDALAEAIKRLRQQLEKDEG
ncbi:MAG: hypothetical protein KGJ86_07550 [Chloroflexota bacterium]|nr:hypothetical protein [Chloroflexota bacterium]